MTALVALLGAVGGAVVAVAVVVVRRRRGTAGAAAKAPDGAIVAALVDVLADLRAVAVAVGEDLSVTRATSAAYGYGLVHDGRLRHPELQDLAVRAIRDGRPAEVELELRRGLAESARMIVGARATPVGQGTALLLIEDRSEARRVDEVRRDFVANVSHELKTPVGAISLLAETMVDAAEDPVTVRHFAGRMRKESERLSRLVHDVIELSRLQTADALTSSGLLDVDAIVGDAVEQARWRADAEHIDIEVGPPAGLRTYGDHDLLVTAVRNLLDNAIGYSPPHTRVSIAVRRCEEFVDIAVTDRGHGIPFAEQTRIFERFYRIDPARSRRTGGTGLGLAIVKHVAENHGGEATVRSSPGQGSTFTLRLPLAVNGADGAQGVRADSQEGPLPPTTAAVRLGSLAAGVVRGGRP